MAIEKNDWRLTNQENYLKSVTLYWKKYDGADHDHCAFCWQKFMNNNDPQNLTEGYTTGDHCHWICKDCCADFQKMFAWGIQ